ncbi:MAG: hypothetical protein IPM14_04550 [bacterium]|nr:hypothetical protein [bacterium]
MKTRITAKRKSKRLSNWFLKNKTRILLLSLLYPNIVCFTPDSTGTSSTFIDFMMGLGKYANVSYNCEGQVMSIEKNTFFDYGGSVSHKIDEFKFGLRAGGFSLDDSESNEYGYLYDYYDASNSSFYFNPFIAFDHKYFELNAGALFLTENIYDENINDYFAMDGKTQFTGLLRIGNKEAFHFSSQYLSNVPLLSGGGMFDMGFGFGSKESRNITWLGLSAGPFQNAGLAVKQNIQIADQFDILLKGRIGQIESNLEGSIAVGANYIF